MFRPKTAKDLQNQYDKAAMELSKEKKLIFWDAMFTEGCTLGQARLKAGIGDVMVAAALFTQMHRTVQVRRTREEIASE